MTDAPPVEQSDFDALLELLSPDTMREVVQLFAAAAPQRLDAARDGIATGDLAAATTAFHTLRSGCGQLGARRLEELCATAERGVKTGNLTAARAQLLEVRAEFARCEAWFSAHGWLR